MEQSFAAEPIRSRRLSWRPLALLACLLLLGVVLAVGVGSVYISPREAFVAIGHGLSGQLSGTADTIIWRLRLPRVLLAALVGAALALAGASFQGVFRNPLADPYLLGAASGAGLGAVSVMVLGGGVPWLLALGVPIAAFVGALLAVLSVLLLARQGTRLPAVGLILAGVVVGSSLSALTSFVMLLAREQAAGVLAWLLGSFAFASWEDVLVTLPLVAFTFLLVQGSSRALNLLQLGEAEALHLGLPVERFKLFVIVAASLATAAAVSMAGVIGFVGLLAPHAVRLALGPDYRRLVPAAALLGAIFLVLADLLARSLIAPGELPIGVITALVGGPFFLYLLRRRGGLP